MTLEEIKDILYRAYDIDEEYGEEERGCCVNGKWLSIKNILDILEEAM